MCTGDFPRAWSNEPRRLLPSTAITPSRPWATRSLKRTKQPWRLGIELTEHPTEGVVLGDAVLQTQVLALERPFGPAKRLHVGAVFATAQQTAQREDQNLVEVVADVNLPRVRDLGETRDELFHAGHLS
jgi:hypothetical protein